MMATNEAPGCSDFLLPALSLPMKEERSRNKERLEASLAGLCELELLKQRQESRVLSALSLGDSLLSGQSPWGQLRSALFSLDAPKDPTADDRRHQTASLQGSSWYFDPSVKQHEAELSVRTEDQLTKAPVTLDDSHLCPGEVLVAKKNKFPESDYRPRVPRSLSAPEGTEETELDRRWSSEAKKHATVADVLGDIREIQLDQEDYHQAHKIETYIFGLIQRRTQHTRPSKPRTSLAHDARAVGVARQSSLCHKDEQMPPKPASAPEISGVSQTSDAYFPKAYNTDQEGYQGMGPAEDPAPPCRHQQQQQHPPGPYHRPRQASRSTLVEYQSFRVLQVNPDSSNSEPDLPPNYHYHSPPPLLKAHQPPPAEDQLVNAKYIPAQPCRGSARASGHQHSNPHKGFGVSKPNQGAFSLERGHHHLPEQQPVSQVQPSRSRGGAKKCRSNEDRGVSSRKQGKKACRSQSENSLQRVPERKYNTVERDGAGSGSGGKGNRSSQSRNKKQQQGGASYRRWQSTLELSQDEAEQSPTQAPLHASAAPNHKDNHGRRTRKSRPPHASYAPHHSHHHQHLEYQPERVPMHPCQPSEDYHHPAQGESESSTSEADSPDSSSLSSDSDESGGLVWPQQLAPQLSLASPPTPPGAAQQPKAFVKIKASHALKKKILRFRTGSLKLMTTV
ncbi:dapper homolog 3-like [Takifugu rubripes]|uniref:Dishevelled-binding antagonist of beta-catenin 3a n=1 Tax=Takifugu rubripes TaxID=31033 RepID=A0A3B5KB51_TAKRU|nr:dapper homolog 3-like [Takifugu rubripes]